MKETAAVGVMTGSAQEIPLASRIAGRFASISTRARFAFAGLGLALVVALVVPVLSRAASISAQSATFVVLAAVLVLLGARLGGQLDALERRSLEDPVTRVGNRRHWERTLSREMEHAVLSRMPLSVLMLDLDNLKRLNDAEGHGCGDRALALLGEVLLASCRSRDVAARLGGDEFAVALPRTRASEALVVAERIRTELERRKTELGAPLAELVSVSIGVADFDGINPAHASSLFEAADQALYAAKAGGRNRVEVNDSEAQRARADRRIDSTASGIIRLDGRRPGKERVTA